MDRIVDRYGNVITSFHQEDGKNHVRKRQYDVNEIMRLNAIDRNHSDRQGDMRKVASIPVVLWEQWQKELKQSGRNPDIMHADNRMWLYQRLNDPQYRKLRTNEERL